MAIPVYTDVKIISLALIRNGKGPINSLAEGGDYTAAAKDMYDMLYSSEIARGNWRFAVTSEQLSLTTETPLLKDWQYVYMLPSDYLKLERVYPSVEYLIFENRQLYSNYNGEFVMEYHTLPSEERLPPYFVNYLSLKLAAELAYSISRDKNMAKILDEEAKLAYSVGQNIEGYSNPYRNVLNIPYIQARGVGERYGV